MPADVLVTGACGMIGSHLVERLIAQGKNVVGTFYRPTIDMSELPQSATLEEMDVRYSQHVSAVFRRHKPRAIFHLAAQSYPTVSWERPQETLDTNVNGTANIFEAVRSLKAADSNYRPIIVAACSSAEYGSSLLASADPIREEAQLLPLHPYGVSKVASDLLAYQYFMSDQIQVVRARIFNTSGPRKRGDVISDFARRVAAMDKTGGSLRVGNLKTRRAFLHVNDTTSALIALSEKGVAGEAYNISGTEVVSVGELVPMFETSSGKKIKPEVDQSLLRPTDEPIIWGDISKICNDTGWTPKHAVADIVADVYGYEAARFRRLSLQSLDPSDIFSNK